GAKSEELDSRLRGNERNMDYSAPTPTITSLIEVNIVVADHLAPAHDFASEQRVGSGRRAHFLRVDEEAFGIPGLDDRRIRHRLLHRRVEHADDCLWRSGRGVHRLPIENLKLRPEHFHEALDVRQLLQLGSGSDAEGL